ncbi:DUF1499 domain-containing protein [Sedimentitalea arenosa]|uniref:DUF1499 domain-containing protein n=1 Tax=Sedimentitalea arenosa TaxID=2798803 RepID=A0A8J7J8S4_9RHOB|nr:DUF1499 domain-containing protein [Arenibacterium arenosum]MBJ6373385.1 DUF1499 domain-containing protein [Arenibacterium arenosum]
MGRLMMLLWVLVAVVVVLLGYIRLAPSDPVVWHAMPEGISEDRDRSNGVVRVIEAGPDTLSRLDAIILSTPRTKPLAGTVEEGMVTYVTRSAVMGFPDYTTVRREGDSLVIHGRARFGRSDLGVNRERVEGWIDALQAG